MEVKQAMWHSLVWALVLHRLAMHAASTARKRGGQTAGPASSRPSHFADTLPTGKIIAGVGAFRFQPIRAVSMKPRQKRGGFLGDLALHNRSENPARSLLKRMRLLRHRYRTMVESYIKAPIALKPFSTIEGLCTLPGCAGREPADNCGRLRQQRRNRRTGGSRR